MRVKSIQWALVAAPALFMTANASGQNLWADNFDSYANGSLIENQGGWTGWWLSGPGPSAVSNAQSNSGPHSGAIIDGSDTVYNWDGNQGGLNAAAPDCGQWSFTGQAYVPSGGVGVNYFILLNGYNGLGINTEWAAQVGFDMDQGLVVCDCGSVPPAIDPAIITDQWVEIRVDVDLDQDVLLPTDNTFVSYNGALVGSYPWSMGVFGQDAYTANKIEGLDLYPVPGSSTIFWDDLSLDQTGFGNCPVGTNYCIPGSFSSGLSVISASGSPSIATNNLTLSANNLPTQPGQFIGGPGMTVMPFNNGFLCVDPNGLQRLLPVTVPDASGNTTIAVDYVCGAQTPTGCGPINVVAGSSFFFQRWNRDPGVGSGSNLSDGIEIAILP